MVVRCETDCYNISPPLHTSEGVVRWWLPSSLKWPLSATLSKIISENRSSWRLRGEVGVQCLVRYWWTKISRVTSSCSSLTNTRRSHRFDRLSTGLGWFRTLGEVAVNLSLFFRVSVSALVTTGTALWSTQCWTQASFESATLDLCVYICVCVL